LGKSPYEILYPAGGGSIHRAPATRGALSTALSPASFLYGLASRTLRDRRMGRRRSLDVSTVVASVGNLEVGGNGKTPLAIHLLNALVSRGDRPVYVSRGFRGQAERVAPVTVLVPLDIEPSRLPEASVRLVRQDAEGLSRVVGDEGAVVTERCPRVPLVLSPNRRSAIRTACAMFEPSHVILDDAFQTWGLHRDVDIVLLDAEMPLGNGRLLPAGSLREWPEALARADAIGFNGLVSADGLVPLRKWAVDLVGREVPVFGIRRTLSLTRVVRGAETSEEKRSAAADASDKEGPVGVLCGIGRPSRFEGSLAALGLDIRVSLRYPDHYRYTDDDVRRVDYLLSQRNIGYLITTEKDWVKMREVEPLSAAVGVARLELDIVGDDPVDICGKPRVTPAASL
jgi:tetraacyldisaccharide 4'-kinase